MRVKEMKRYLRDFPNLIGDDYAYLNEIRAIRGNGGRVPDSMKFYAVKTPYDAPPFFYVLLAFLQSKPQFKRGSLLFNLSNLVLFVLLSVPFYVGLWSIAWLDRVVVRRLVYFQGALIKRFGQWAGDFFYFSFVFIFFTTLLYMVMFDVV